MTKSTARALPTPAPDPDDAPLRVVLTCGTCATTYEPSAEDWAWRRTSCPDPDCQGWTWTAALAVPDAGGAS